MHHVRKSPHLSIGTLILFVSIGLVAFWFSDRAPKSAQPLAPIIIATTTQPVAQVVSIESSNVQRVVNVPPQVQPVEIAPSLPAEVNISALPEHIIQGDPIMLTVNGSIDVTKLIFNGKSIQPFLFNNKQIAFIGIDLNQKPATYILLATLANGSVIRKPIVVEKRQKIEAPLGIPEKLGGNTPASQKKLVDTLAKENASLVGLKTEDQALWTEPFQYPVANPVVTDDYGYSRQTGDYSISHKGTDFRAVEGTPVLAMNDGIVRLAKTFVEYGNTVVIDHGLGLMTFYMHLSKLEVKTGDSVKKAQEVGLSGQTGYADQPHLHLTLRINDISIDPIVFLNFFK